ncbi:MAG TPA: biopolymer transporter ExbD [Candidatus Paceibacterota bacterium]|nr:biopolymer transporter ExbD [Verrucomicrobiota bacterium]HOX03556.1 biopolymer transporter ExbD [Verrucomicrobiota bacterium]HRZ46445.1 biopolymer transporter ExbD [Candidatus Paceibacterota bacterium]
MRRFSQRNYLVTLSDINITPLLDLAFVLLIIFVITTPLLTQSIDLRLPPGGRTDRKQLDPRDVRTIEISRDGQYRLDRRVFNLAQIEAELAETYRANPNLVVYIRADKSGPLEHAAAILDLCQRHDITRFSLRTEPARVP